MWSIHPAQIRPIVAAFAPAADAVATAAAILLAAEAPTGAPSAMKGFCTIAPATAITGKYLQRAAQTGLTLPDNVRRWFAKDGQPVDPIVREKFRWSSYEDTWLPPPYCCCPVGHRCAGHPHPCR